MRLPLIVLVANPHGCKYSREAANQKFEMRPLCASGSRHPNLKAPAPGAAAAEGACRDYAMSTLVRISTHRVGRAETRTCILVIRHKDIQKNLSVAVVQK
jgi:hypothetical protein